ncbi:MAG: hypothetical protein JNL72_12155 [Flavipsychrobacter sp.]|nr:hypothetical protein [Flavipsychrobacter sp.]
MKTLLIAVIISFSFPAVAQVAEKAVPTSKTTFSLGGCGITNRHTEKYEELMKIVSEKNVQELFKWLRSDDLGIQLYALEGYKRLAVDIDDATRALISTILDSKSEVLSCAGCFVSYQSVESIVRQNDYLELLKK